VHDSSALPGSLSGLAAEIGVHPTHLARPFRRRHGCTVGSDPGTARIRGARGRLVGSDVPVAEIAIAAGFADQSHLGRTFKRLLGLTRPRTAGARECAKRVLAPRVTDVGSHDHA